MPRKLIRNTEIIECSKDDCFANESGSCRILVRGYTDCQKCKFFKTEKQCEDEEQRNIERTIRKGAYDSYLEQNKAYEQNEKKNKRRRR